MEHGKQIIVALDVDTASAALGLVSKLHGKVGLFKIGSQLFTAEGPQLIRDIVHMGERVFLDLKLHDIPNTIVKAGLVARSLGVSMMTVHTSGGAKMMSMLATALKSSTSERERPLLLGVTVLTSLAGNDLKEIGYGLSLTEQVLRLARLAEEAGLDGVVAAPSEIEILRQNFGDSFKIVVPGIRQAGADAHDQNRIATPVAAIRSGADYLVIGRPIIASPDPLASLEKILQTITEELAS